jgi:hypothetical protein
VTPDQFKTGERIALDIVLPKLDDDADAVAEAVKNKGRRGHGASARSNAVKAIKTAIVKKSRTLSCSPESYAVGRITVISSLPAWPVTVCC